MQRIKGEDIPAEQRAFTSTWNMLKEYYLIQPGNDKAWFNLLETARQIGAENKGTIAESFTNELVCLTLEHIQRLAEQRKDNTLCRTGAETKTQP